MTVPLLNGPTGLFEKLIELPLQLKLIRCWTWRWGIQKNTKWIWPEQTGKRILLYPLCRGCWTKTFWTKTKLNNGKFSENAEGFYLHFCWFLLLPNTKGGIYWSYPCIINVKWTFSKFTTSLIEIYLSSSPSRSIFQNYLQSNFKTFLANKTTVCNFLMYSIWVSVGIPLFSKISNCIETSYTMWIKLCSCFSLIKNKV